eukprot:scaffold988_cov393-Pavlova_lutheri.AAC.14
MDDVPCPRRRARGVAPVQRALDRRSSHTFAIGIGMDDDGLDGGDSSRDGRIFLRQNNYQQRARPVDGTSGEEPSVPEIFAARIRLHVRKSTKDAAGQQGSARRGLRGTP